MISGVTISPDWYRRGNQDGAWLGYSVATAGDVNGNGYSDVIVGAPSWDNGIQEYDEGKVYGYHGSASGLNTTAAWFYEGNQETANLGVSVACAGDVNGDGYADVLIGAGTVQLFYGNGVAGKPVRPRQIWMDYSPIARLRTSDSRYFMMQAFAFSPMGRGDFKLTYEVDSLSSPFDGIGAVTAGDWADTNLGGMATVGTYMNLVYGQQHHWRIRFKYSPVTNPFNPPYSRWGSGCELVEKPGWVLSPPRLFWHGQCR